MLVRPRRLRQRAYLRVLEQLEPRRFLSLTHLYTFNDGTANDSVGTTNGTLYNGAAVSNGRLQMQNAGITSGGAVQYARLNGALLPATGSATIYAWYYTDSDTPTWMRVFDFGNGSAGSYLFYTPKSSSSDARASFDTTTATAATAITAAGITAAQGYRNFAAVVVDASTDTLSLYLNGALAGSAPLAGANIGAINEAYAYLGRSQYSTDAGFSGSIDELRIYDEARSAAQIAADDVTGPAFAAATSIPVKQAEKLDRGIIALPRSAGGIYVSWRLLGTDPSNISFNLYRSSNNGAFIKLNSTPISATTDYSDTTANRAYVTKYYLRPVINGIEQPASETCTFTANFSNSYLSIPLHIPAGGTLPDVNSTTGAMISYTYSACDTSVGDVDGDGQYEFIVRWDPSNSKDNSQSGYTGNVYIDAYKMNGTFLWRIDLGKNIRAGAHYTQFQVYDLDGDGKAEVAMKTAPGTIDGQGHYVLMGSDSPTADYRNSSGYILSGPEYLTVFNGLTGAAMATAAYAPDRGTLSNWGDNYGNRVDRFLAAVAYLDGTRPSLIEARGYYTGSSGARNEITAWNYRNGQLTRTWWFKADLSNNNNMNSNYTGQGAHAIEIADLDMDGKDEILYGACAIDDDGRPMWSTGLGHGDAIHVSDMDPARPGEEIFQVHEGAAQAYGGDFRSGITGKVYFGVAADSAGVDVGRGMAADIDPRYPGYEMWDSATATLISAQGTAIGPKPSSQNFGLWWDGDLGRELLDGTKIDDWNYASGGLTRLVTGSGVSSNNGTKATPCLSGDILGDWREEVVWRASDNSELRIYSTTTPATNRIYTLMHDIQYREAIAWQNSAYNQPPNPSFFIGYGMSAAPAANIYTVNTSVVGRYVFYADSAFDGASADNAIAPDKAPLFAGQIATLANATNYSRGLNGIVVDIAGTAALSASDFAFRVGNDSSPLAWRSAPVPSSVVSRRGAGVGGSTRVEITWNNNAIVNQWLQVTVKGGTGSASGLAADDVFYFGNMPGNVCDEDLCAKVNAFDQIAIRYSATSTATLANVFDINRDGAVNAADENAARQNYTYFLNELQLIAPPGGGALAQPAATALAPTLAAGNAGAFTSAQVPVAQAEGTSSVSASSVFPPLDGEPSAQKSAPHKATGKNVAVSLRRSAALHVLPSGFFGTDLFRRPAGASPFSGGILLSQWTFGPQSGISAVFPLKEFRGHEDLYDARPGTL